MQPNTTSQKKILTGVGIIILAGAAVWFVLQNLSGSSTSVQKPTQMDDLAQTIQITPEEGGLIRAVDSAGVVITLNVPPGAVTEETEVTLIPFSPAETGLQYGVRILPENIDFLKPTTLSFNWYISNRWKGSVPYTKRPFVSKYTPDTNGIELAAPQRAQVVRNYLPVFVTGGGWYGVNDNETLLINAANTALETAQNPLSILEAGAVLQKQETLSQSQTSQVREVVENVLKQDEPELNELNLALLLNDSLGKTASLLPYVYAYGTFDGYLQFRCNHEETSYGDAVIAMDIALNMGYSGVVQTCLEKAKREILKRAQKVDANPQRPVIDAIEVVQQMQLLGVDDTGEGQRLAESLSNDINATLDDYLASHGQEREGGTEGRVRSRGASDDPLMSGNSTLILEMLGAGMMKFAGVESFDEQGLKKYGEEMHERTGILLDMADELCDLDNDPDFAELKNMPGWNENCAEIESGALQKDLDQWKVEVGEYAEGVDAVQKGQEPNEGWDSYSGAE